MPTTIDTKKFFARLCRIDENLDVRQYYLGSLAMHRVSAGMVYISIPDDVSGTMRTGDIEIIDGEDNFTVLREKLRDVLSEDQSEAVIRLPEST